MVSTIKRLPMACRSWAIWRLQGSLDICARCNPQVKHIAAQDQDQEKPGRGMLNVSGGGVTPSAVGSSMTSQDVHVRMKTRSFNMYECMSHGQVGLK
jgi:hypothetical protein